MLDAWLDLVHGSACLSCGRPGRLACRRCERLLAGGAGEVRPEPAPPGLARCCAAGEYADPLRAMLLAHKEHGAVSLTRPLAACLAGAVLPLLAPPGPVLSVLVPVPSRAVVVRRRGHDPLGSLVRGAARRLDRPGRRVVAVAVLEQHRVVADQAGLDAPARLDNLRESMAVRPLGRRRLVAWARPLRVVVCDDVITTGATAWEAQRALVDGGVGVAGIAAVAATRRHGR